MPFEQKCPNLREKKFTRRSERAHQMTSSNVTERTGKCSPLFHRLALERKRPRCSSISSSSPRLEMSHQNRGRTFPVEVLREQSIFHFLSMIGYNVYDIQANIVDTRLR